MTETTLEQRIRRLEDLEAIRDLTARYADAINKGWNGIGKGCDHPQTIASRT
ncbi:hypothetical protein [Nocardia australiensis]|uniref:hypothetical protein n=1 Tax=Nocardia australiensis TaxID=2887191 RepID=UPI001D14D627|nr:hypothetical protein [Nocardia australiensis]